MSPLHQTDAWLLARVPDPDAVGAFYARHVPSVLRFASRRCRDPHEVADLVGCVFLEVFAAAPTYDPRRGAAQPWLYGIAGRCLADLRRDGYRQRALADRLGGQAQLQPDEYERIDEMLDAARAAPAAEHAIATALTDSERELLLLVTHDGLSVADAARSLGLSPVAGRMRLTRARRKLRARTPGAPDPMTATTEDAR